MKIESQSKGVNISAIINTDALERTLSAPYRERIKHLEGIIKKRESYIKNMHYQLRRRKWIMYLGFISHKIMKPLPKKLNVKRMLILFYMYERNFTSIQKIQSDFKQLGVPHTLIHADVNILIGMGLARKDGKGFYYLLDKGREVVEYYEKNTLRMFFNMAKIKQDITQVKEAKEISDKPGKYSEEELKNRADRYRKLMKPFWDTGYTIMPKDNGKRIEIVSAWIKKNRIVDEWYIKLIFNWGSKSK